MVCFDTTGPELFDDFLVYSSVISVVMFALPFMLVMVCYGLMVHKLLEPSWGSGEGQQKSEVGEDDHHRAGDVHVLLPALPPHQEPVLLLQIPQE